MQTFLQYPSFEATAKSLDYRRLGKQRVEAMQILKAMERTSGGWVNHPATKMWRGHRVQLCRYAIAMCDEWIARGFRDNLWNGFVAMEQACLAQGETDSLPSWFGRDDIHSSHRSNLLRKKPEFYSQFGWSESPDLPYIWPVP